MVPTFLLLRKISGSPSEKMEQNWYRSGRLKANANKWTNLQDEKSAKSKEHSLTSKLM